MRIFALILLSLTFVSTSSWASSSDEVFESVIGTWQTSNQDSRVNYRAIYVSKFGTLKMVDCKPTTDESGTMTNAVVCDAAPNSGVVLKYSSSSQSFKVVNHGLTKIIVSGEDLIEQKAFGIIESKWEKTKSNIQFLFYNAR